MCILQISAGGKSTTTNLLQTIYKHWLLYTKKCDLHSHQQKFLQQTENTTENHSHSNSRIMEDSPNGYIYKTLA